LLREGLNEPQVTRPGKLSNSFPPWRPELYGMPASVKIEGYRAGNEDCSISEFAYAFRLSRHPASTA
jgi:hypothetical protein